MQDTTTEGGRTGGRQWIAVAGIVLYTLLLLVGTIGELFHVDWILRLPIFRGP